MVQGRASFLKGKHPVYDWVQAVGEEGEHALEVFGRTHSGTEDVQLFPENAPHHQFGGYARCGPIADDAPAGLCCVKSLIEGFTTSTVNNQVGALTACGLPDCFDPVGRFVVKATTGTYRLRSLQLLVAARCDEYTRSHFHGNQQCEGSDAATNACHQHRISRLNSASCYCGAVRCQTSQRQRGSLFIGEASWARENSACRNFDHLRVSAVIGKAQDTPLWPGDGGIIAPFEAGVDNHGISYMPTFNALAESGDFTNAI